jgi:transporter family protein
MKNLLLSRVFRALLSAAFAALTAIFAKIGIENVNPDFATFIRTNRHSPGGGSDRLRDRQLATVVQRLRENMVVPGVVRACDRRCMDLLFSRPEAGRRRSRRPDRQAQRGIRCRLRGALSGERLALPNWLGVILIACGAVLVAHRA